MPWERVDDPDEDQMRQLENQFRKKARFLIDESAGIEVANLLENQGYNTKFVQALGLHGRSDEDVFAAAWREQRVIVTHDADFLDEKRFPDQRNPGIVVIRPGSGGSDSEGLIRCLVRMLLIGGKRAKWFRGTRMEFLHDGSHKISYLSGGERRRDRFLWTRNNVMRWVD